MNLEEVILTVSLPYFSAMKVISLSCLIQSREIFTRDISRLDAPVPNSYLTWDYTLSLSLSPRPKKDLVIILDLMKELVAMLSYLAHRCRMDYLEESSHQNHASPFIQVELYGYKSRTL